MALRGGRTLLGLGVRVACCCIVWFGSSIAIICELRTRTPLTHASQARTPAGLRGADTNKYYLSVRNFRFPLTVNYCTNTGTYLIALALSAARECVESDVPAPASTDVRLTLTLSLTLGLSLSLSLSLSLTLTLTLSLTL